MADRPIIFSASMIRALLSGSKTQTRRILKPQPIEPVSHPPLISFNHGVAEYSLGPNCRKANGDLIWWKLPAPGDRLWVREAFWIQKYDDDTFRPAELDASNTRWRYVADGADGAPLDPMGAAGKLRPSIHIPRWASRLTLIVEGVKIERLQDISEEDARAEGVERISDWEGVERYRHYTCPDLAIPYTGVAAKISFSTLWESIHGEEAWIANPWVVAISFRVVKANIDATSGKDTL